MDCWDNFNFMAHMERSFLAFLSHNTKKVVP
jgi:hypothetical protein